MGNKKQQLLESARLHVARTIESMKTAKEKTSKQLESKKEEFKSLSETDRIMADRMIHYHTKQIHELAQLILSPYFVRCDVIWENEDQVRSLYFAKFPFSDEGIYSWVAPASAMRFEDPGHVSYVRPDGKLQKANLVRKDQFVITNSDVKFMATESVGVSRELIYQEHFSNRKEGFVLPEIVAQMEKAQDQVIRAHHQGAFVISGPAGSGKTTLALHRVAYLATSPDLAETFTTKSMIVFVQDASTKEYFSHLLPELGIDDVEITTFSVWALKILEISAQYLLRCGRNEHEKDLYEYAKITALRRDIVHARRTNPFTVLTQIYEKEMTSKQLELFATQKKKNILDRIDLTILLMLHKDRYGSLGQEKDIWDERSNGKYYKKRKYVDHEYSLAVVDEFQNYLPEQLELLGGCIDLRTRAILYVGDMAQQVQLGTIRQWSDIQEQLHTERQVMLDKVYRNTTQILKYIQTQGYDVEIPKGLKTGPEVKERIFTSTQEEVSYIKKELTDRHVESVGILLRDEADVDKFEEECHTDKSIHIMTLRESQGVEFDIVFLVGIVNNQSDITKEDYPKELQIEKERITRDLFYVALTRAITEMHVLRRE